MGAIVAVFLVFEDTVDAALRVVSRTHRTAAFATCPRLIGDGAMRASSEDMVQSTLAGFTVLFCSRLACRLGTMQTIDKLNMKKCGC